MILQFEFVKHNGTWYFLQPQKGRRKQGTSALVELYKEGLHTLLDHVGKEASRVVMHSSDEPVAGSDELELTQPDGDTGGYYLLHTLGQQPYVLLIHFFDVRAYFGYRPSKLYIKMEVYP